MPRYKKDYSDFSFEEEMKRIGNYPQSKRDSREEEESDFEEYEEIYHVRRIRRGGSNWKRLPSSAEFRRLDT